jgi:hypothetical protein
MCDTTKTDCESQMFTEANLRKFVRINYNYQIKFEDSNLISLTIIYTCQLLILRQCLCLLRENFDQTIVYLG